MDELSPSGLAMVRMSDEQRRAASRTVSELNNFDVFVVADCLQALGLAHRDDHGRLRIVSLSEDPYMFGFHADS